MEQVVGKKEEVIYIQSHITSVKYFIMQHHHVFLPLIITNVSIPT